LMLNKHKNTRKAKKHPQLIVELLTRVLIT